MGVPGSTFAIAAFVALALPGLILVSVRRVFQGSRTGDGDVATLIAQAVLFSSVLDALYFWILGNKLFAGLSLDPSSEFVGVSDPKAVGATVLVFAVLIPLAIAMLLYCRLQVVSVENPSGTMRKRVTRRHGYSSVPNAWDFAWRKASNGGFVRIRRADGTWLGGWYTEGSFVSAFPEQRDVFVAQPWVMSEKGAFVKPSEGSQGLWFAVRDDDTVEWRTK